VNIPNWRAWVKTLVGSQAARLSRGGTVLDLSFAKTASESLGDDPSS
jgi:hypothetical protein